MIDRPWDVEGTIVRNVTQTISRTGAELHARATSLAREAMNKIANNLPVAANQNASSLEAPATDYARAKADYAARSEEMRKSNHQAHIEANNRRAREAAERRAARQAAHKARNEAAAEAARRRRIAKAA